MRSVRRTVLVFGLVFFAGSLAQAAPRVRDVWHSYIADGKRYGYVHTVVVRLPDGNFRITRETRLLVDVLGINKEEITERGEYVVTADYRPVSIAVEGKRRFGRGPGDRSEQRPRVRGDRGGGRHRAEPGLRPARDDPARTLPRGLAGRSAAGLRGGRIDACWARSRARPSQ